jgi:hypothetical protein
MRKTIYLPDDLAARVDEYLKIHQNQTFSSLVQTVLEEKVVPKNRRSILELAGIVDREPDEIDKQFVDHPEDSVVARDNGST